MIDMEESKQFKCVFDNLFKIKLQYSILLLFNILELATWCVYTSPIYFDVLLFFFKKKTSLPIFKPYVA